MPFDSPCATTHICLSERRYGFSDVEKANAVVVTKLRSRLSILINEIIARVLTFPLQ